mmetsp:Transcript_70134/g.146726  ORF Transcript_70134/g.146726 Transcript_70134/m.146726 type:complete len:268 (-) Transcript_70134:278-1081(-)
MPLPLRCLPCSAAAPHDSLGAEGPPPPHGPAAGRHQPRRARVAHLGCGADLLQPPIVLALPRRYGHGGQGGQGGAKRRRPRQRSQLLRRGPSSAAGGLGILRHSRGARQAHGARGGRQLGPAGRDGVAIIPLRRCQFCHFCHRNRPFLPSQPHFPLRPLGLSGGRGGQTTPGTLPLVSSSGGPPPQRRGHQPVLDVANALLGYLRPGLCARVGVARGQGSRAARPRCSRGPGPAAPAGAVSHPVPAPHLMPPGPPIPGRLPESRGLD